MLGSLVFMLNHSGEDFWINDRGSIDTNFSADLNNSGPLFEDDWENTSQPYFYYIQLTSIDGLYGSDIRYESDPLPNEPGEISGDVIRGGKGVTLSGTIWAPDVTQLENASQYLNHMFWDTSPRYLYWWPANRTKDYNSFASDPPVQLNCRVNNDLVIGQNLDNISSVNQLHNWSWTVGVRADDPRIYNWDGTPYQDWQT